MYALHSLVAFLTLGMKIYQFQELNQSIAFFIGKVCVSHDGAGKDEEPIVLLANDSWEKCRKILEVRKLKQRKYMDVCVPSSVDESSGYLMDCCRRFTALVKPDREYLATLNKEQKKVSSTITRSSTGASFIATISGVFVKQCIFCKKKDKKFKGAKQTLIMVSTENIEKNIKTYAEILKDEDLLRLILDEDFASKEMCYHSICRVEYQNRVKLVSNRSIKTGGQQNGQDESWWHFFRRIHNEAFKALFSHY